MNEKEKNELVQLVLGALMRSQQFKNMSKQQIEREEKKRKREDARRDRREKRRQQREKDRLNKEDTEKKKWEHMRNVDNFKPGFVEATIPKPEPIVQIKGPPAPLLERPEKQSKTFVHKPAEFEHAAGTGQTIADLSLANPDDKPQKVKMFKLAAGSNITITESSGIITIAASSDTPVYDEIELTYCASGTPTTRTFLALPLP